MKKYYTEGLFDLNPTKRISKDEIKEKILSNENDVELIYFNYKGDHPIIGVVHSNMNDYVNYFTIDGKCNHTENLDYDLKLFILDIQYEDYDILVSIDNNDIMFMLNANRKWKTSFKALMIEDRLTINESNDPNIAVSGDNIDKYRVADQDEINISLNLLYKEGSKLLDEYISIHPNVKYNINQ